MDPFKKYFDIAFKKEVFFWDDGGDLEKKLIKDKTANVVVFKPWGYQEVYLEFENMNRKTLFFFHLLDTEDCYPDYVSGKVYIKETDEEAYTWEEPEEGEESLFLIEHSRHPINITRRYERVSDCLVDLTVVCLECVTSQYKREGDAPARIIVERFASLAGM